VDTNKRRAEDLCGRINGALGWRACDPELRNGVYTGSVILRERGADALARLAEEHGLRPAAR
jgi:hypothetical protein